jgi:chromosome segregation ATPase
MSEQEDKLKQVLKRLEKERDELKLQAGLAKLEARDDWDEIEKKLEGLRGRLKVVGEEAYEASGDVGAALDVVADEIKAGFERIKKMM